MIAAPSNLQKNSRYRRAILERAEHDVDFQEEQWIRCSRDPVYFINTYCWTFNPKSYPDNPNRLFVLWPAQERAALKIISAIGKHRLLLEKSRTMGMTWLILAVFVWYFLFRSNRTFLCGSRKEKAVEGDDDSLFSKIDYLLARLPKWMVPPIGRKNLHFENLTNNSKIDGESTNTDFGRGGRRTAIFIDEFPAIEDDYAIIDACAEATDCLILGGTPEGASGAYYDIREKLMANSPDRVIRLHWHDHPIKGAGMYRSVHDDEGGGYVLDVIDKEYKFPRSYKFILDGETRSPAYDAAEVDAPNPQYMARNWNIGYLKSGWQYFPVDVIETQIKKYAIKPKPKDTGELVFPDGWKKPEWIERPDGHFQIWFDPDPDRGPRSHWSDIVIGADIAQGGGTEKSSNSVAAAWQVSTGQKIAQFTSNAVFPADFAQYVLAMAYWLGDAFIIWEANGPGAAFGKVIVDSGYRRFFYRRSDETDYAKERTNRPGFWTNKDTKRTLIDSYLVALKQQSIFNRSEAALRECLQYVTDTDGSIIHARSKSTPDPSAKGENHGDMVIADALAVRAFSEIRKRSEKEDRKPPEGSFEWRRQKAQKLMKQGGERPIGIWPT
jgi:hypothetical protein